MLARLLRIDPFWHLLLAVPCAWAMSVQSTHVRIVAAVAVVANASVFIWEVE